MLNMLPTNDRKLLDSMSFKIFSSPFEGDIGYIFYEDDKPIGFAKLVVGDTSIISAIGILPDYRGKDTVISLPAPYSSALLRYRAK